MHVTCTPTQLPLGSSALRVDLVGAGAWFTGDILVVLWLMLAVVVLKLALLIGAGRTPSQVLTGILPIVAVCAVCVAALGWRDSENELVRAS